MKCILGEAQNRRKVCLLQGCSMVSFLSSTNLLGRTWDRSSNSTSFIRPVAGNFACLIVVYFVVMPARAAVPWKRWEIDLRNRNRTWKIWNVGVTGRRWYEYSTYMDMYIYIYMYCIYIYILYECISSSGDSSKPTMALWGDLGKFYIGLWCHYRKGESEAGW